MLRRRPDLSWPLLVLLFALFALSVHAPRHWEAIARLEPLGTPRNTPKQTLLARIYVPLPTPEVERHDAAAGNEYHAVEPAGRVASQLTLPIEGDLPVASATEVAVLAPPSEHTTADAILASTDVVAATTPAETPVPPSFDAATAANKPSPIEDLARIGQDAPREIESPASKPVNRLRDEVAMLPNKLNSTGPSLADTNALADVRILRDVPSLEEKPRVPQQPDVKEPDSKPHGAADDIIEPLAVPEPKPALPEPVGPEPVVPEPALSKPDQQPAKPAASAPKTKPAPVVPAPQMLATPGDAHVLAQNWEEPTYLLARIEQLEHYPSVRDWSIIAADLIRRLGPALAAGDPKALEMIDSLDRLTTEAARGIPTMHDFAAAQDLCRVGHAIDRHVVVWRQIAQMGGLEAANSPAPTVDHQAMNAALTQIDALTKDSPEGNAWRKYLMTDSLREWLNRHKSAHERLPREMGQQVLKRLNQVALSQHQRQFMTTGPMASLHHEIVRQTAEPVATNRLLRDLEVYEQSGLPSDGRRLAYDCQYLSVSSGTAQQALGRSVEAFYRNANLRLAISGDLLNRMMPKRSAEYAPVADTIRGVQVRGQSLTASDISIKMLPDPHRALLALLVNGEVSSLTQSTAGPATFYNDSDATYSARKPMEVTLRGFQVWPTEVSVDTNSRLRQIRTDYDHVPLVGPLVRSVARSKHDEEMPAADAEVREKIAAKAKQRVDDETSAQINRAAQQLRENLLGPMDALLLDPMMIAAETNEQRFNMRIRLAGNDQLGGYTPRPQAPADSLASVQIHESMINNVLERLELDGNTFTIGQLGMRISQRLHRPAPKPVDPDQDDVKISFAAQNALHVRCTGGRMEVTLAIAKLAKGGHKWKDFEVRAIYRPEVHGRNVELAREGVVQMPTPHFSTGSQIVLRGVFSKVFSQKENVKVTPASFVNHPKLDGMSVTQFVIDDGWIGAAIGPERGGTVDAGGCAAITI